MIKRNLGLLGVAIVAAASTLTFTGAAATAGEPDGSRSKYEAQAREAGLNARQASRLQDRVDGYLMRMEVNAHQFSANEIVADDGSGKLTLALPTTDGARPQSTGTTRKPDCDPGNLCMFAGDYYDHDRLDLYECGYHKLRYWDFENRLTSYINNQTYKTEAVFSRWTGSEWMEMWWSAAPDVEADLDEWDPSFNNRIDMVELC